MGGTPDKLPSPVFFLKPSSSVIGPGENIVRPNQCKDMHYEVELGVVIGKTAKKVQANEWKEYVSGYCVAIDVTARDIQAKAKKDGMPWTIAKGFDTFTPLSDMISKEQVQDPHNLELWLKVNGVDRQRGSTNDMMTKIPELVEEISSIMTLYEGDVILTGTPEGVGPMVPGDVVEIGIEGLISARFGVKAEN